MSIGPGTVEPKPYLEKLIAEKPLVMISAQFCPSCTELKKEFSNQGIDVEIVELYDDNFPPNLKPTVPNIDEWWKAYAELTGKEPTPGVPKTWVGGRFIGGGDDTLASFKSGELMALYHAAKGVSAPKEYLQKLIIEKPLVMISAEFCPSCTQFKKDFKSMGVDVDIVELYDHNFPPNLTPTVPNIDKWWEAYAELTGQEPTPGVPKTWVGGRFIGGGDGTAASIESGELMALYHAAKGVPAPKEYLQKLIAEKPLVMISAEFCPTCTQLKKDFKSMGIEAEIVELYDKNFPPNLKPTVPNIDDWWKAYAELTGLEPTPGIPKTWLGGKFVGGGDDTNSKLKSGELLQTYNKVAAKPAAAAVTAVDTHYFLNGNPFNS